MLIRTALAAFALVVASSVAYAQATPTRVATFQDWSAYTYTDANGTTCYIASQPTTSLPAGVNRDPIFFTVSTRTADNVREEISVRMGYPLNPDAPVTATIDTDPAVTLYTRVDVANDGVWVEDPAIQAALIVGMKRGVSMVIRGRSQRGTDTTDTYSLRGITAALDRMATDCPPAQ